MDFIGPFKDKKVWVFGGFVSALTAGVAWALTKWDILPAFKLAANVGNYGVNVQSTVPTTADVALSTYIKGNGIWPSLGTWIMDFFKLQWNMPAILTALIVGTLFTVFGYAILKGFGVLPNNPVKKVWAVLLTGFSVGGLALGAINGLGAWPIMLTYAIYAAVVALIVWGLNKKTGYPAIP